ncbi:hypothetical protein V2G26_000563 [Clonostachys chloroleuca]
MSVTRTKSPASATSGHHFVSGLGSGVASAVILQPLDLLKTRMQQSGHSSLRNLLRDMRQSPKFVASLWRGTLPSALRTGFGSALYFTTLSSIRQQARNWDFFRSHNQLHHGSSALPTLMIKVRFESNLYSYPSLWAAAKDIQRVNGFRGFFSGFGATAMRDAPYAGSYVLFYELLKSQFSKLAHPPGQSHEPTKMQASVAGSVNFASASLAAGICSALSNPFDAIKTRIQLQPEQYRNMAQAAYKMVTEDGFRSLWDGLGLRMGRKAMSSALAWTVYEELIRRAGTPRSL